MWAVSNHLLLGPEEVPTYQLEQTGKTLRVTEIILPQKIITQN